MDARREAIAAKVDEHLGELLSLSQWLHDHPETAWQEHESAQRVSAALGGHGFDIHAPYGGLDTAFRADFGSGDYGIGVIAEYDALPGLGHACGHNLIAAIAVGAALGLQAVVGELDARISVVGTPAEEGGGGKIKLLEANGFAGLDVAGMVHPGPVDVAHAEPFAVRHIALEYRGRGAHAAAYPEFGVNAADAMVIAQTAIGLLRQQLPLSVRVHGQVTQSGEAPNAIAEVAKGRWYLRASSMEELDELSPRVLACFEAGALATGCSLEVEDESAPYDAFVNHQVLNEVYRAQAEALGRSFDVDPVLSRMNRASTDMGNVSHVVASIHPYIGVGGTALNHQRAFAEACVGPEAQRALRDGAIALACSLAEIASDETLRTMTKEFSRS